MAKKKSNSDSEVTIGSFANQLKQNQTSQMNSFTQSLRDGTAITQPKSVQPATTATRVTFPGSGQRTGPGVSATKTAYYNPTQKKTEEDEKNLSRLKQMRDYFVNNGASGGNLWDFITGKKTNQQKYDMVKTAEENPEIAIMDSSYDFSDSTKKQASDYADMQKQYNALKQTLSAPAYEEITQYEANGKSNKWISATKEKYDSIPSNADFESMSKEPVNGNTQSQIVNGNKRGWDNINDLVMAGENISDKTIDLYRYSTLSSKDDKGKINTSSLITDEQRKTYNYIYNKHGEKAADAYVNDVLSYSVNKAYQDASKEITSEKVRNSSGVGKALYSAESVATNVGSSLGFLDASFQRLSNEIAGTNRPVDYNTGSFTAYNTTQSIRNTVQEDMSGTGQFLYGTAMSMADSLTAIGLGALGMPGSTFLLGGAAATDGMMQAKARGATDGQATTMGLLTGAAEMIFEELSLEKLITAGVPANAGEFLLNMAKQAGTEGSEEFFTSIANTVSDIIIMGDKSELMANIALLEREGVPAEKAKKQAFTDWFNGLCMDALGGALSGGIFGAGGQTISSVRKVSSIRGMNNADSVSDATAAFQRGYGMVTDDNGDVQNVSRKAATQLEDAYNESLSRFTAEQKADAAEQNAVIGGLTGQLSPYESLYNAMKAKQNAGTDTETFQRATANSSSVSGRLNSELYSEMGRLQRSKREAQGKPVYDGGTVLKWNKEKGKAEEDIERTPKLQSLYQGSVNFDEQIEQDIKDHPEYRDYIVEDEETSADTYTSAPLSNEAFAASEEKKAANVQKNAAQLERVANNSVNSGAILTSKEEFINGYDGTTSSVTKYTNAFYQIQNIGARATSESEFSSVFKNHPELRYSISPETAMRAFTAGFNSRGNTKMVTKKMSAKATGSFTVKEGANVTTNARTFLTELAKRTGVDIVVDNLEDGVNAKYIPEVAKLVINSNSNTIVSAMHELGHDADFFAHGDYTKVKNTILEWFAASKGVASYENLVKTYEKGYAKENLSRSQIETEIVNDALGALFNREDGAQELADWIVNESGMTESEQKTFVQKVKQFFDDLIKAIKGLIDLNNTNLIQKDKLLSDTSSIEMIRKIRSDFLAALDAAKANREATGEYVTESKAGESTSYTSKESAKSMVTYSLNISTIAFANKYTAPAEMKHQLNELKTCLSTAANIESMIKQAEGRTSHSIHDINKTLEDNPELHQKLIDLQTRLNDAGITCHFVSGIGEDVYVEGKKVAPGMIGIPIEYVEASEGSSKYVPRTSDDYRHDGYKFTAFKRTIPQMVLDSIPVNVREQIRGELIKAVEYAYEAGTGSIVAEDFANAFPNLDFEKMGKEAKRVAGTLGSPMKGVQVNLRKAEKTVWALNTNSACPMFTVGNHGCYLDACYLTQMANGATGTNLFRTAWYTGEILQLPESAINQINSMGGLRLNGVGDTTMDNVSQLCDVLRHCAMRGISVKIISKQRTTLDMIAKAKEQGTDLSKVTVQLSMDNLWIPAELDDAYGSGLRGNVGMSNTLRSAYTLRQDETYDQYVERRDNKLNAVAEAYEDVYGRATRIVDGKIYRKYGFSSEQIQEMIDRKNAEFPEVTITPRYVVCTAEEIAYIALNEGKDIVNNGAVIQTLMHGKVPDGCISDFGTELLNFGGLRHVIKRNTQTGIWEFYGEAIGELKNPVFKADGTPSLTKAGNQRMKTETDDLGFRLGTHNPKISANSPYQKVLDYVYGTKEDGTPRFTKKQIDKIFFTLQDSMCCQTSDYKDACAGCQSLCASRNTLTNIRDNTSYYIKKVEAVNPVSKETTLEASQDVAESRESEAQYEDGRNSRQVEATDVDDMGNNVLEQLNALHIDKNLSENLSRMNGTEIESLISKLNSYESSDVIYAYKSMSKSNDGLIPPMSERTYDENGKLVVRKGRKKGEWWMSTESPELAYPVKLKSGKIVYKFDLKQRNSKQTGGVNYNPYEHAATNPLNDQFSRAYERDELVTVIVAIPKSELDGKYKAEKANNSTGLLDWHTGTVAGQLENTKRQVYLSRYANVVGVLSADQTAEIIANTIKRESKDNYITFPDNVVNTSLRNALEKQGIEFEKSGKINYESDSTSDTRHSISIDVAEEYSDYLRDDVSDAININNGSWLKFVDKILAGTKTVETRKGTLKNGTVTASLDKFMDGNWHGIAKTGTSKGAVLVGYIKITGRKVYDQSNFHTDESYAEHQIPTGLKGTLKNKYDIADGGYKVGYTFDVQPIVDSDGKRIEIPLNKDTGYVSRSLDVSDTRNSRDVKYMEAVESGDEATQRKLVEEAAKEAGYTIHAYHGTGKAGFTVFDSDTYGEFGLFGTGNYFTEDINLAKEYTAKETGGEKAVYGVYLKVNNAIDMDKSADVSSWKNSIKNVFGFSDRLINDSFYDVQTNEDAFRALVSLAHDNKNGRAIQATRKMIMQCIRDMGYDGITHIGGGRINRSSGVRHRVWITFDKGQQKSDAPATYRTPQKSWEYTDYSKLSNEEIADAGNKTGEYNNLRYATESEKKKARDIGRVDIDTAIENCDYLFKKYSDDSYITGALRDFVECLNEIKRANNKAAFDYASMKLDESVSFLKDMADGEYGTIRSRLYSYQDGVNTIGDSFENDFFYYDDYGSPVSISKESLVHQLNIISEPGVALSTEGRDASDLGDLIPLSERFNQSNEDIRFSRTVDGSVSTEETKKYTATGEHSSIAHLNRLIEKGYEPSPSAIYDAITQSKLSTDETRFSRMIDASESEYAPTFYSKMARTIAALPQPKYNADQVAKMLLGKGVKEEEIKWSGLRTFLDGKKSVTKQELLEYAQANMMVLEEQTLDGRLVPLTEEQVSMIDSLTSERDEVVSELKSEWESLTGTGIPFTTFGNILEHKALIAISKSEKSARDSTDIGKRYNELREGLRDVIRSEDDFGYDTTNQAFMYAVTNASDFVRSYEMSDESKAYFTEFARYKELYKNQDVSISDEDRTRILEIAKKADSIAEKITNVKSEQYSASAKFRTEYHEFTLASGKNYREYLFKLPGSDYTVDASVTHWGDNAPGTLIHARVDDAETESGSSVLFVEEIQSDWHNARNKKTISEEYTSSLMELTDESEDVEIEIDNIVWDLIPNRADYQSVRDALSEIYKSADDEMHQNGISEFDSLVKEYPGLEEARELVESRIDIGRRISELKNKKGEYKQSNYVAPAPFEKTYTDYAMKRLLREASEKGFGYLAWTTGQQQWERWENDRENYEEGFRIEYDQDIPKFIRKFAKQFGASTSDITLDNGLTVHAVEINDAMRQSVLYDGQALYSRMGQNNFLTASEKAQLSQFVSEYERTTKQNEQRNRFFKERMMNAPQFTPSAEQIAAVAKEFVPANVDVDMAKVSEQVRKIYWQMNMLSENGRQKHFKAAVDLAQDLAESLADVQSANTKATEILTRIMQTKHAKSTSVDAWNALVSTKDAEIMRLEKSLRDTRKRRDERIKQIRENHTVKQLRETVIKRNNELRKMLLDSDVKKGIYVPDYLKQPLSEFAELIDAYSKKYHDTGSMLTKSGKELKADFRELDMLEAIRKIANRDNVEGADPYYINLDDSIVEDIDFLVNRIRASLLVYGGKELSINLADSEQLKSLNNILRAINAAVRGINESRANGVKFLVRQLAMDSVQDLSQYSWGKDAKRTKLRDFMDWKMATPYYAFKRFGTAGETLFKNIMQGWAAYADDIKTIQDFLDDKNLVSKKQRETWGNTTTKIPMRNSNGDAVNVELTYAQLMNMYLLYGRENAKQHLEVGGIVIPVTKVQDGKKTRSIGGDEAYHFDGDNLDNVFNKLTPQMREVADKLKKFINTTVSPWGNEITNKLYDISKFTEKDYWPMKVNPTSLQAKDDGKMDGKNLWALMNMGMTKNLSSKADQALLLDNVFTTFGEHAIDMAKYHTVALPVLDAVRWFNFTERSYDEDGRRTDSSVRGSINNAFGASASSYLYNFLADLNSQQDGGRDTEIASLFTSTYKAAAVGANLRVAALQTTAIARAGMVISPTYLAKGAAMTGGLKEMEKYSGIFHWKDMGFYDVDVGRSIRSQIIGGESKYQQVHDAVVEKSMILAEYGDKITWAAIWNACKLEQSEKTHLKGEELMKATEARFEEVVFSTQVFDSTVSRSQVMRSRDGLAKTITSFMSEPTLSYNLLMDKYWQFKKDAAVNGKAKAWQKNSGIITRALAVYAVTNVLAAVAESLFDAIRDDDDDELIEKIWKSFIGDWSDDIDWYDHVISWYDANLMSDMSIIAKTPVVKDFVSAVQGYSMTSMWDAPMVTAIDSLKIWREKINLKTGILDKATKVTSYGKLTTYGAIYKTLNAVSQLTGLPMYNATRDVVSIYNTTIGTITGNKILRYDDGMKDKVRELIEDGTIKTGDVQSNMQLISDAGLSIEQAKKYFTNKTTLDSAGIDINTVGDYYANAKGTEVSAEKAAVINEMQLTTKQKDALWRYLNNSKNDDTYNKSGQYKTPWHWNCKSATYNDLLEYQRLCEGKGLSGAEDHWKVIKSMSISAAAKKELFLLYYSEKTYNELNK